MTRNNRNRMTVEIPGNPDLYQPTPLTGWKIIGVVRRGSETGALVQNDKTGMYCIANDGKIQSLPQHKILAALRSNHP